MAKLKNPNELQELRIVIICILDKALCQEVLFEVVFALAGIGQIAVTRGIQGNSLRRLGGWRDAGR